ncbi:MAG: penicillin-binding transpeptidase domain-containing protein, partial [Parvibaculales bacterium]
MVSSPSFDLNKLSRGIEVEEWERLIDHERKPLVNKAMRGLYAPGSTFKMLVALAALEEKLIDPEEKISCSGVYK